VIDVLLSLIGVVGLYRGFIDGKHRRKLEVYQLERTYIDMGG